MNEKIISYVKKYISTFLMLGAATCIILLLRQYSPEDSLAVKYLNIADAFTIPGVIILMVGVLIWIHSMGNFDMILYGFSRAKHSFIPSANYTHETFYDYKQRKSEKRIKGYSFLFVCGGVYMIPAIVFNVLYALCS